MGYFNTPLSPIDHPDPHPSKKNQPRNIRVELHYRLDGFNRYLQTIPSNGFRIHSSHQPMKLFSKTDCILNYKASLNKQSKRVISYTLTDHNKMKLEVNSKRKLQELNIWRRLNSMQLNKQWIIKEISGGSGILKFLELNKNGNTT